MNCEYCQSPVHIWFQCPKKPDGWKPARLAKKSTDARNADEQGVVKGDLVGTRAIASTSDRGLVGQSRDGVLPVDTNSEPVATTATNPPRLGPAARKDADPPAPKPTKFDKKTWQRKYMSSYMAQYKADVKAGKRVPKKREC